MPPRIYKYEPFSTQSLENLKAQSIYFGSPRNFNDPYDCAFAAGIRPPTDTDVENIRAAYIADPDTPEGTRQQFERTPTDELRKMLMRAGRSALDYATEEFMKRRGVSCFSERNDDLLMWSHYAGKYRGFCLEFDTSHTMFEKIIKVNYSANLPAIDLAPLLASDNYDQVLSLFTWKSESWKYEQEWRAIHAEAGTLYTYDSECLSGVYFGPEMSDQAVEIVCLVLQGQNENVKFWRGRRSSTEFKVVFEHFTYMSYLEARKRGLR